jgi:hypothetical protein
MVELGYQKAIACDATFGTNDKKILSHVHATSSMIYHYRTSKYVTICFVIVIVIHNDAF